MYTIYVCSKCGYKSADKNEIEKCELYHEDIDDIMHCTDFTITEKHLELLKQQLVKFRISCEYGATEIDPKRPYGNSYVEGDMLKILNMQGDVKEVDGSFSCSPELERKMYQLHVETTITLQICMALLTFETGKYTRGNDWISGEWKRVE